jgi:hypothetical protein
MRGDFLRQIHEERLTQWERFLVRNGVQVYGRWRRSEGLLYYLQRREGKELHFFVGLYGDVHIKIYIVTTLVLSPSFILIRQLSPNLFLLKNEIPVNPICPEMHNRQTTFMVSAAYCS